MSSRMKEMPYLHKHKVLTNKGIYASVKKTYYNRDSKVK